jgi:hypothetical protein
MYSKYDQHTLVITVIVVTGFAECHAGQGNNKGPVVEVKGK